MGLLESRIEANVLGRPARRVSGGDLSVGYPYR